MNTIEEFIDELERDLRETGEKEISAQEGRWPANIMMFMVSLITSGFCGAKGRRER